MPTQPSASVPEEPGDRQFPLWQILLSVVLMLVTTWGLLGLSSRIYRVGILKYGKRPTLPELRKWLRYAG